MHSYINDKSQIRKNTLKKNKTGVELKSCFGLLKKDKETRVIENSLKKRWKEWTKRYI